MNDHKNSLCARCGGSIPPGGAEPICPRCAAAMLQNSQTEASGIPEGPRGFTPPGIDELRPLFPQLEILELLGCGGMGAVYKARQKELDRIVALKILPPGIGSAPAFAERFAREAKAMARLNHPGIITIHDFGRTGELYFFLMEFVDGLTLRELMDRGGVSSREALAIVPQICDALQYAHDHGIVHRDIKPANVLIDRRGRVKVADFGLAKLVDADAVSPGAPNEPGASLHLTRSDKVMGTPAYMAPEQAEKPGEVDHRADIYALGVVLYQMLTGQLPSTPLQPPSVKVQLDVRLDEVVLQALQREPQRRYQQASQIKTAVESIAATLEAPGATASSASPKQRRWPAFVGGVLSVLLVEFGAVALNSTANSAWGLGLALALAAIVFIVALNGCLKQFLWGLAAAALSWLGLTALQTGTPVLGIVSGAGAGVVLWHLFKHTPREGRAWVFGFIPIFALVLGAGTFITIMLPKVFASSARINLMPRVVGAESSVPHYDPYLIQTEFEVLLSQAVLSRVITNLNLLPSWSRQYTPGSKLSTGDAVALLQAQTDIHIVRNTSLIEVRVFGSSPEEPARIANEIVRVFMEYRMQSDDPGQSRFRAEIVDSAVPSEKPVRPNKPLNLAIAALVGLLLGSGVGTGAVIMARRRA
jgi:capsular polysaccharide biosynthesis protein